MKTNHTDKLISMSEIAPLYQMSKTLIALADEISALDKKILHIERMAPKVGIIFLYEGYDNNYIQTVNEIMDVQINLEPGENEPLREAWFEFQRAAIRSLNEVILEKRKSITDISKFLKKE